MSYITEKSEPVFELVKSMDKAEKRNFRLYANRLAVNKDSKFLALFDCFEQSEFYNEKLVLNECKIGKEQLANVKAHLYRQLLVSLRLLAVKRSEAMQIRENLDFAGILYDKGLYRQSDKFLEKVRVQARGIGMLTAELDVLALNTRLDMVNVPPDMTTASDHASREVVQVCERIIHIGELSNIAVRSYSLYQQLGYARTRKDIDLIIQYFKPRLEAFSVRTMNFREKFYYYQAMAWYYYIQHEFVQCYRYSRLWVELFESHPRMKTVLYEGYIKGASHILEGLYLMRKYRRFCENLDRFEREFEELGTYSRNAYILSRRIIFTNRIHKCFTEGEFAKGLELVADIEDYLRKYSAYIDIHMKMLIYYKIACLYFGSEDYRKCMLYLGRITSTRDPRIRRDLQCFARILNLIASYESGMDYNLDYQIKSVYSFLMKMNDLNAVQKEMLRFLKKLNSFYVHELNSELKELYERLLPYESHPFERRPFFYLDLLSWLEARITGKTVGEVIRHKFREQFPA